MSWKVLITATAMAETGQSALALLRGADCHITSLPAKPFDAGESLNHLSGMDAVIAGTEPYPSGVLSANNAAALKIISRWGVGYDAIDVSAATSHGIVVSNAPGLLDEAVADYTFALLLTLARQIHVGHLAMHSGNWRATWGWDISGKTLGLIGCGRIGLAVAKRAVGFNLRLLAFDPHPNSEAVALGVRYVTLEELLAQSDFISLHAAVTPANRNLIGEAQLRKMKSSALLINVARGALVDENALARALRESWIAGAASDVFCAEPLPADHPFRTVPNILLTPHQASFARDTGERVSQAAAQAILDLMAGRKPKSVVNPEVFASQKLRAKLEAPP